MGRDTRMKVMLGTLVLLLTLMELTFPRLTKGEENYIESYAMNDPYNIRKLENGEYLYRIGKDLRSNAVYWARMGNSKNMINAAQTAKQLGMDVITFTGFKKDNPLKQEGDLNFWLDSHAYNIVENTHQIWLLMVCDLIIGKAEYSA